MPPPQQNTEHQEVGFTRHQLYVLRSQILAFRRIKVYFGVVDRF
jgi:hypothetical protein